LQQVWVPTEFHRELFEAGGVHPKRLQVLGEPVDTDFFNPSRFRQAMGDDLRGWAALGAEPQGYGEAGRAVAVGGAGGEAGAGWGRISRPLVLDERIGPETFVFLSVFKWEDRKGWDILLEAFFSEFGTGD
ncbi:unnamed protein product, partial [Discosporangium mesarthrocarpum]